MQRPNRILVPVDFSDFSVRAICRGSEFANLFGADLMLCHVFPPQLYPEGMGFGAPTVDATMEDIRHQLSELADSYVDPKVACEAFVSMGTPYNVIVEEARERDVDLIIMPTHGRSGFGHMFIGSTAERVIRGAPCEVLVIRGEDRDS